MFRSFVFPTVVFRANILSRRPPFLARRAGEEGGRGEGEGALAVLYSTGAEPDATRFRRVSVHLRPGSQLRRT